MICGVNSPLALHPFLFFYWHKLKKTNCKKGTKIQPPQENHHTLRGNQDSELSITPPIHKECPPCMQ